MTRLLIKKFIGESQLLLGACSLLLVVFCASRVWICSQFDLSSFQPLLDQLKWVESFMPVPLDQVLTYEGSIALTLSEPMLILAVLVWCISRGSDVVSGELGRGTLEMLLANPIARRQLVVTHAMMASLGLGVLCVITWTTIHFSLQNSYVTERIENAANVSIPFLPINIPVSMGEPEEIRVPLSDKVDSALFVVPCINLFGFGFVVLSASIFLSCCDRYRWRCIGVTLGIYVTQLLIFMVSKVNDSLKWAESLTFLSLYQADLTVLLAKRLPGAQWRFFGSEQMDASVWHFQLGPIGMVAACVMIGTSFLVAAIFVFDRRDLPAPL